MRFEPRLGHNNRNARWAADIAGIGVFMALTGIVTWNRFVFDGWLARHDLLTLFFPLYTFLGDQLRAGDAPGWNPHLFSGTPFAGDPQSGWMYLPPMLFFPFLDAVPAIKAMIGLQLVIAGVSTYALARVLGMRAISGVVAAVIFSFGPLLQHSTYCCTVRSQIAPWIPLALLGAELSLRATRWRDRAVPCFLAGFAISQMFAGWLGQGVMNALLVVASYIGYRAVISPPDTGMGRSLMARVNVGVVTGLAVLFVGLAFGAAGLLPRLAVNPQTVLAGGNYEELTHAYQAAPYTLDALLWHLIADGYTHRAVHIGGAALVLALLAPVIAGRRFAVPYFAGMSLVVLTLSLGETPLHQLFYLLPRYEDVHEHYPPQVNAVVMIGPAILAGATVERVSSWRGRRRILPFVVVPLVFLVAVIVILAGRERPVEWPPLAAAVIVTALIVLVVAVPSRIRLWGGRLRLEHLVPALILAVAFLQPTGLEIIGSVTGQPLDPAWEPFWDPSPAHERAIDVNLSRTDPDGAGEFFQNQLAASDPFRYAGYSGLGHPENRSATSYENRRMEPAIQSLLVSGRPVFLDLYSLQGFNPNQLTRYAELMQSVNGQAQDYHLANVLPGGVDSPLLDVLDVQYLLVDAGLPADRDDMVALNGRWREAFRTEHVIVYEQPTDLPHAWIVHDVRQVDEGEALEVLMNEDIDVRQTALVEGAMPAVELPDDSTIESARITVYEPDAMTIDTRVEAPGLLVVSELYESGWQASVDGEKVEILPTNHALRGIPLAAGEHTVELRYEPAALRLGMMISGLTTLAMVIVFAAAGLARIRHAT